MDPLRPFTALIRSLRNADRGRSSNRVETDGPAATNTDATAPTSPAPGVRSLNSRLQTRLTALGTWDAGQAREQFVECILLNELGEDMARDPSFNDLVKRVSAQLGSEPRISARLDAVLQGILHR